MDDPYIFDDEHYSEELHWKEEYTDCHISVKLEVDGNECCRGDDREEDESTERADINEFPQVGVESG